MATLPLHLEIEDIAYGPVLVLLKKTPGIIKLYMPFLDEKPTPAARPNVMNIEQTVVALFARHHGGPLQMEIIQEEVGGGKSRAYGALHNLKKKGILVLLGKGEYEFSAKAKAMMQRGATPGGSSTAPLALPKPKSHHANEKAHSKTKLAKTPSGRAKQGTGPMAVRQLLTEKSPMTATDIRLALDAKGLSPKSVSGIIDRGRRDGLIRKLPNGTGYELTAKGKLQEAPQQSVGA
jgi:DNA-binding PadR family transcriptional regulator